MTDTPESIHAAFCLETGMACNFRVWERAFLHFITHGFTTADLEIVLRYLKRENKRMTGAAFSLRPDKIFDFEYMRFDSLLGEARAKERNIRKAQSSSERAVAAYEKPVDPEQADSRVKGNGRHISDFLRTPNQ